MTTDTGVGVGVGVGVGAGVVSLLPPPPPQQAASNSDTNNKGASFVFMDVAKWVDRREYLFQQGRIRPLLLFTFYYHDQ